MGKKKTQVVYKTDQNLQIVLIEASAK